jgi:hypothetical protein
MHVSAEATGVGPSPVYSEVHIPWSGFCKSIRRTVTLLLQPRVAGDGQIFFAIRDRQLTTTQPPKRASGLRLISAGPRYWLPVSKDDRRLWRNPPLGF